MSEPSHSTSQLSQPPSPQTTCYVPQELQAGVDAILPLIHELRSALLTSDKHLELEIRLGRRNKASQRWESEVSGSFFMSTVEMLKAYNGWTAPMTTHDLHDYFYTLPPSGIHTTSRRVRTTMTFDSPCSVTHVVKSLVGLKDLKLEHTCDARISLKEEAPLHSDDLPDVVQPNLVRIKRRTSFYLPHWRIDLTQVWHGATRTEAEQSQVTGNSSFEVEVEFTGDRTYISGITDQYLATSLLLKLCSVLGSGVIYMVPLPQPSAHVVART